jgi:hypothetical protein
MSFSVGNLANAYFCAEFFNIPLKEHNDVMVQAYTPKELYDTLASVFGYVFLDVDPAQSFKNGVVAEKETRHMGEIMTKVVADVQGNVISRLWKMIGKEDSSSLLSNFGPQLVRRLSNGKKSVDEVVWTIIPTAAAACATQAQGVRSPSPSLDLIWSG